MIKSESILLQFRAKFRKLILIILLTGLAKLNVNVILYYQHLFTRKLHLIDYEVFTLHEAY